MGVCGGVVIEGTATDGIELIIGVGLLPCAEACNDANVAIEDCEFDLVGLPGLTWNDVLEAAGDGTAGGMKAGEALASPGDGTVGVVKGVLAFANGLGNVDEIFIGSGCLCVGCEPL